MELDDSEIAQLLDQLASDQDQVRKKAAEALGMLDVASDPVTHALELVAAHDTNLYVRRAALLALRIPEDQWPPALRTALLTAPFPTSRSRSKASCLLPTSFLNRHIRGFAK